jgi:hypothetical protein
VTSLRSGVCTPRLRVNPVLGGVVHVRVHRDPHLALRHSGRRIAVHFHGFDKPARLGALLSLHSPE